MRLWTIHPRYLDPAGLVAVWREGLLARAVLNEQTRGYRNHPQLERFRSHPFPVPAINAYLSVIFEESVARGYRFDRSRLGAVEAVVPISATTGQMDFEWSHLMGKLSRRRRALFEELRNVKPVLPHPLFQISPGPIASWERISSAGER